MKVQRFIFTVPEELHAWLKQYAEEHKISMSQVIRQLIDTHKTNQASFVTNK